MSLQVDSIPTFSSSIEEVNYWRQKALTLEKECKDVREELDEFQEGSRELEAELEMQLEQTEKKNKELKTLTNRLYMENEQLKDKLEQCHQEYNSRISELQNELSEIRAIKEQLNKYVRELEQQNDDLERAKRSTVASLEDFEIRMNAAIERNVYLESELDEKEALKAAVQRLKDETKDLRSELKILAPDNDRRAGLSIDSNKLLQEQEEEEEIINNHETSSRTKKQRSASTATSGASTASNASSPITPNTTATNNHGINGSPHLTPSARISALNIVGGLLRKVGALELKLVSCRNIVKENQHKTSSSASASNLTPNSGVPGHRLPRVASTPAVKDVASSSSS